MHLTTVSVGDLEITAPMVGENQWTCKATNEILSMHYKEETTISFNVRKYNHHISPYIFSKDLEKTPHTCSSTARMRYGGVSLRWRHNGLDSVSNHQPPGCLLNRLFRRKSKKTSKLRVTGLCAGNSPGTGEFSAQMASYAENVSIWWRHHVLWVYSLNKVFVSSSRIVFNIVVYWTAIYRQSIVLQRPAIQCILCREHVRSKRVSVFMLKSHRSVLVIVQLRISVIWFR